MTNDPVLIAYAVRAHHINGPDRWTKIGVAFPHERGAGLTVVLDAVPLDGRIVLLEPSDDARQLGSDDLHEHPRR